MYIVNTKQTIYQRTYGSLATLKLDSASALQTVLKFPI